MKFLTGLLLLITTLTACQKTQSCIDKDKVDYSIPCTNDWAPVCGCDNVTYRNECYADKYGVVSYVGGECPR